MYAIPDLIMGRVHLLTAPVSSSVRSSNTTENDDDQQVTFFTPCEAICLLVVPEMLGSKKGAACQMHMYTFCVQYRQGLYLTLLPVLFYDGASV